MAETAAGAMDKLLRLLSTYEPWWIKSTTSGKYVLHRESYERLFPNVSHFSSATARDESSKDVCLVTVNGNQLVEMFLDPNKWVDLFPTIVTKVSTIHVLDNGVLGTSNSSLQLRSLCSGAVFGAERWTVILQRMCERFTYSMEESTSFNEFGGVISSPDGKRGMKKLAHRMVNSFCATISMSGNIDFPHPSEINSGVRVSVRKNMELGQPSSMIVQLHLYGFLCPLRMSLISLQTRQRALSGILSPMEILCLRWHVLLMVLIQGTPYLLLSNLTYQAIIRCRYFKRAA